GEDRGERRGGKRGGVGRGGRGVHGSGGGGGNVKTDPGLRQGRCCKGIGERGFTAKGCGPSEVRVSTGRTGAPRRHRPGRKRRVNTALLTVLAAAIAATLLVVLGARALSVHATCNGQPPQVRIAVSGEIEPVIAPVH